MSARLLKSGHRLLCLVLQMSCNIGGRRRLSIQFTIGAISQSTPEVFVAGETGIEFIGDLASARLPQQPRRQLYLSKLLQSFMMTKALTDSCEFGALRNKIRWRRK